MPLNSGSWWHDILAIIPFLMTGQLRRGSDLNAALAGKIMVALVVSLLTGAAGGAIGSYVALHIQEYRQTQIERTVKELELHRAEDKAQFAQLREEIRAEIATIRERHRIEEETRRNGK